MTHQRSLSPARSHPHHPHQHTHYHYPSSQSPHRSSPHAAPFIHPIHGVRDYSAPYAASTSPSPRRDGLSQWSPRTREAALGVQFRGPSVPSHPGLPGVRTVPIELRIRLDRVTEPLGLHCKAENGRVLVTGMVEKSAGLRSGVMIGDVITQLGGYEVHDQSDMRRGRIMALDKGALLVDCTVSRVDVSGPSPSPLVRDFSPEAVQTAKKLGVLQAALNADALTQPEFEEAVLRAKGGSQPREEPTLIETDPTNPTNPTKPEGEKTPEMPDPTEEEEEDVVIPVEAPQSDERFRRRPVAAQVELPEPPVAAASSDPAPSASSPAEVVPETAEMAEAEKPEEVTNDEEFDPNAFPALTEEELRAFPRLSEEKLAGLKDEFTKADRNGDGVLRDKELLRAFLASGMQPEEAHHMVMFALIVGDSNGDGQIDYNEFVSFHTGEQADQGGGGEDVAVPSTTPNPVSAETVPENAPLTLSSLPPEMVEALVEQFKEVDTDNSGTLTKEELSAAMAKFASSPEEAEGMTEEFMAMADTDADGVIDYEEFMKMHFGDDLVVDVDGGVGGGDGGGGAPSLSPEHLESIKEEFAKYDTNGDGFITEAELHDLLAGYDEDGSLAAFLLASTDADGDGKINFQEFLAANSG